MEQAHPTEETWESSESYELVGRHIKNEWLAELLLAGNELVIELWIRAVHDEHVPGYNSLSSDQLRRELPVTVGFMIQAFRAGDLEVPRQNAYSAIRRRLEQGFHLSWIQASLYILQNVVMRIVDNEDISLSKLYQTLLSTTEMYTLVSLMVAEVYEELRNEQQRENDVLYEAAKGKRELQTLLDASKVLTSTLESQDIPNKIVMMAAEAVQADYAVAYLLNTTPSALPNIAYYSRTSKARHAIRHMEQMAASGEEGSCRAELIQDLADQKPILFNSYTESPKSLRPLLGTAGSGILVPLRQKGSMIGSFALLCLEPNSFSESDLSLATALADLGSIAIENSRLYEYERRIAETLQRSFLPEELPGIEGYGIAAFYKPAMSEAVIGGDFYDVFPVSGGEIAIVVGDVSGKGLHAAVSTAMAKYMIRGYAVDDPRPAVVMRKFNKAFCVHKSDSDFITVLYGLLTPDEGLFRYVAAGHFPPLVHSAHVPPDNLVASTGMIVGVSLDATFEEKSFELDAGDALLVYTDGATDVRKEEGRLETEGLNDLFIKHADSPADEAVDRIFADIKDLAVGELPDDIVILMLKRLNSGPEKGSSHPTQCL